MMTFGRDSALPAFGFSRKRSAFRSRHMGFVGSITIVVLLALAGVGVLRVANLPYLPLVHGSSADEVERLAAWLDLQPGTRVADLGAGDGTFAVALARIVGPSGHVYATELDDKRLARIRRAATEAGVANITAIRGAVSSTRLPDACCDAVFSRAVYHHLTDAAAVNTDLFRALRPGGRLVIIDFEPGGIMDWIGRPETADRSEEGRVGKECRGRGEAVV